MPSCAAPGAAGATLNTLCPEENRVSSTLLGTLQKEITIMMRRRRCFSFKVREGESCFEVPAGKGTSQKVIFF